MTKKGSERKDFKLEILAIAILIMAICKFIRELVFGAALATLATNTIKLLWPSFHTVTLSLCGIFFT